MQIPLQIAVRGMAHSPAMDERIREKVAGLERFHSRVTGCRVTVSESHRHQQQGRHFEVRIDVRVPGHSEIVVNRQHDEDVYVAMRDAFDAATRQLEDVVRTKRDEVKSHESLRRGALKRTMRP